MKQGVSHGVTADQGLRAVGCQVEVLVTIKSKVALELRPIDFEIPHVFKFDSLHRVLVMPTFRLFWFRAQTFRCLVVETVLATSTAVFQNRVEILVLHFAIDNRAIQSQNRCFRRPMLPLLEHPTVFFRVSQKPKIHNV